MTLILYHNILKNENQFFEGRLFKRNLKRGRQEKISSLQMRSVTKRLGGSLLFEESLTKISKIEVKQDVPDCFSGDILIRNYTA